MLNSVRRWTVSGLAAAIVMVLGACADDALAPSEQWVTSAAGEGRFSVAWRSTGMPLARNESRDLDVAVDLDGEPAAGLDVAVRGWMPDHGHGMVRTPPVRDMGAGRYRVEGLLLHMRGRWDLHFDLRAGDVAETVSFVVDL